MKYANKKFYMLRLKMDIKMADEIRHDPKRGDFTFVEDIGPDTTYTAEEIRETYKELNDLEKIAELDARQKYVLNALRNFQTGRVKQ